MITTLIFHNYHQTAPLRFNLTYKVKPIRKEYLKTTLIRVKN